MKQVMEKVSISTSKWNDHGTNFYTPTSKRESLLDNPSTNVESPAVSNTTLLSEDNLIPDSYQQNARS